MNNLKNILSKELLYQKYRVNFQSLASIGKEFGVANESISKLAKEYGIPIFSYSEISQRQGVHLYPPPKDELENFLLTNTYPSAAQKYGVCKERIGKWAKA